MALHGYSYSPMVNVTTLYFIQHRDGRNKGLWLQLSCGALAQHHNNNRDEEEVMSANERTPALGENGNLFSPGTAV